MGWGRTGVEKKPRLLGVTELVACYGYVAHDLFLSLRFTDLLTVVCFNDLCF